MKKLSKEEIKGIHRDNVKRKEDGRLYIKALTKIHDAELAGSDAITVCGRCRCPLTWGKVTFLAHDCNAAQTFLSYNEAYEIAYGAYHVSLWEASA